VLLRGFVFEPLNVIFEVADVSSILNGNGFDAVEAFRTVRVFVEKWRLFLIKVDFFFNRARP